MRTLVVLLMVTVMSEWCRAGELLEVNENTKANIGKLLNAGTKPNVHFADQIDGFNSSTLKSGPIVLQDKRTIFISDLQYKGKEQTLSYWAGTSNPNGKKTLISKQPFEGNHSNVDLSMSSLTITLDNVTFIGVGEEDHLLAYVMLVNATGVNISLIREDRKSVSDIPVYTVPKCCPQKQLIYPETGCGEVPQSVDWNVTIFESNVTGLDPDIILDGSQYELNLYHYKPKCDDGQLVAMSHNEIYGLIYNSSLIIKGEGIKAHHQFCVDTSFDSSKRLYETITIVCYSVNEQVSNLYIYLPELSRSNMYAVIICIFVVLYTTVVKSQCPSSLKVNITDGITGENYILHDGIVYVLGQYEIIDDAIWGCPCSVKPCIRKCCPDNEELTKDSQDRTQCVSSNYTLDVKVYDGTHPVKEQVDFFTIHGAQCSDDSTIVVSTKFYIQKNGYFFDDNAIYYPPDSYCLDYYNGVMIALICVKPLKTSYWALIIDINVILSTICFIVTAIMYRLILTDNIILKKCIISFSSSMCLVFISLIIMNVQANASACKIFGFSFLTLTVFSFFWLPISCIELFYLVLVPFENRQKECRWYYYIGVSSALSICILAVSLFSGQFGVPDIPDTFIRHPSSCKYDVGFNRTLILFVPMILSFTLSMIFIVITTKWIQKNDNQEEVRNTYYWIQNRNNYKFMCRTYMVIIFASLLWCAHLFYDKDSSQLPLDVLEAALGILTLAALVLNKYTRREISNLYRKKPTVAAHSIPLNSMATPATPDVESNPFFPNNHANNAGENNR